MINLQKKNKNLKKLIKNEKFIKEILKINDNQGIIKKFNLYGVDLNKVEFNELCNILENNFNLNKTSYEVASIDSPIAIDHSSINKKTIINFKD